MFMVKGAVGRVLSDKLLDGPDIVDCSMSPDQGGSSEELTSGFGMSYRLTNIGLTKAFFNFRQEAEPFDRVLKGSRIRKSLDNLQDLLLDRFGDHRNHFVRLAL